MGRPLNKRDKSIEKTVNEILKSRAKSSIYTFLLRRNGARSDEIIKGTKLHPSTVREMLSKMYEQKLIYRKKIKNDSIGKNPYIYFAISPISLLKQFTKEIEERLNMFASLPQTKNKGRSNRHVKIKIYERVNQK